MVNKRRTYLIHIIVLLLAVLLYGVLRSLPHRHLAAQQQTEEISFVRYVIDGDTVVLLDGKTVRLIGIDTPEARYNDKLEREARRARKDAAGIIEMGKKATQFTKKLAAGKRVRLEYDIERQDKYGRDLAYVFLDDGTFVNARIVEEGYAQVLTIPPNLKYSSLFIELQKKARDARKGLWVESQSDRLF